MSKQIKTLGIIFLFFFGGLIGFINFQSENVNASESILYVGGTGAGNYSTIQSAINAANPGDTIYVWAGTYNEHVTIRERLTLIGNGTTKTTINGGGIGTIVLIKMDSVTIKGFTITNGDFGITTYVPSNDNAIIIDNNVSFNNFYGIFTESSNNKIKYNNVYSNFLDGIALGSGSLNNTVTDNNVYSNSRHGIVLWSSSNNTITNNNVYSNNNYGIYLYGSSINNNIKNCNISNNINGINLGLSSNATIHYNNIFNNTNYGINNTDSSMIVDAINNGWGHYSGPYDPSDDIITGGWYNPQGEGDNVTDYVKYMPWLGMSNYPPYIITNDISTATEDEKYNVVYTAFDPNDNIINWNYRSNASWLNWGTSNHTLYGIPTNANVGTYWICINISDGEGGFDEHNFTLTVLNVNYNPMITTKNIQISYEDELYEVDYNATDVDSLISNQIWSLDTNAKSWLDIDTVTGIISGIPTNDDIGGYWVNVSVEDGDNGFDWTNFTLIVLNVNDRPVIVTSDRLNVKIDELYFVDYNASDIDSDINNQVWSLKTNASLWLDIDWETGILSGIPINVDVGVYWVNVSVSDNDGGIDFHNFTLTVYPLPIPLKITTEDVLTAIVDKLYMVDYNASDVDTPQAQLSWSLNTNASWLSIDSGGGVIRGTPTLTDVGSYRVNVSVTDGENGWDYHEFTLRVIEELILPPELISSKITPTKGDTETEFTFSVIYGQQDDIPPDSIQVIIDGIAFNMSYSNGRYEYVTKLTEGEHIYYFTTILDTHIVNTDEATTDYIEKADYKEPDDSEEDNMRLYMSIGIVAIIVIVALILIFLFIIKKKSEKKPERLEEDELSEE